MQAPFDLPAALDLGLRERPSFFLGPLLTLRLCLLTQRSEIAHTAWFWAHNLPE